MITSVNPSDVTLAAQTPLAWRGPLTLAQMQLIGGQQFHAPVSRPRIVAGMQRLMATAIAGYADKGGASRYLARALREYFAHNTPQAEAFLLEFARTESEPPELLALAQGLLAGGLDAAALLQAAMSLAKTEATVDVAAELMLLLFSKGALNTTEEGVAKLADMLAQTMNRPAAAQRLLDAHKKQVPHSSTVARSEAARSQALALELASVTVKGQSFKFCDEPLSTAAVQGWLQQGLLTSRAGVSGNYWAEYSLRYATALPQFLGFQDQSFAIYNGAQPIYYCQLTTGFSRPGVTWTLVIFCLHEQAVALDLLIPHILKQTEFRVLAQQGSSVTLTIVDGLCPPEPFLLDNYAAMLAYDSRVDLTLPEEALWTAVRKSFKPIISKVQGLATVCHINREQTQLQIGDVTLDDKALEDVLLYLGNMDPSGLAFAREQIACYRDWIAEYGGEISVVWHHTLGPIAATIITDYHGFSTYCWGRSAGPVLDPLTKSSHLALWDAICRAKARGNRAFNLGPFDASGTTERKSNEIAKFKHGFATDTTRLIEWSKVLV